ncbi:hypothetical protein LCGC14_1049460 [marine sediment metagenome]|uniref:Uncharacterized protein n=1 Tax=marine sediment metagenome TaxID=412755 RepID=A0A0F9QVC0_9ZZZZ
MVLSITQGDIQHSTTWQSVEDIAQSTATVARVLDNDVDISFLGVGTATGDNVNNKFELLATSTASGVEGDAIEGMIKTMMVTGTGFAGLFVQHPTQGRLPLEAMILVDAAATGDIDVTAASATGVWVMQTDGDFLQCQFINGTWNFLRGAGATMHTAT